MASNSGEFFEDGLSDDSMPSNDEADYENFFGTQSLHGALDVELLDLDLDLARPFTQLELPIMHEASSGQLTDPRGQDVVGKGQQEQRKESKRPAISTNTRDRHSIRARRNAIPAGAMVIDVDATDMSAEFPITIKEEDPDLSIIHGGQPVRIKQESEDGKFEYWNFTDESIDLSSDGEYEQILVDVQRLRTQSPQIPTSTDEQLAAETSSQDLPMSQEWSGAITSLGTDSDSHGRYRKYKAPVVEDLSETEGQSPKGTVEPDTETTQEEDLPQPGNVGQGDTSDIPINHTTFKAGTSMLKTPNPQAKHTEAQIARMKKIQLILAERGRKKPLVAGAGAIFSGKRTPAVAAQAPPERVAGTHVQDVEDEFAWMRQTADDDEDPAAVFREIKKSYKAKKRTGRAKPEDDILFMRAEREENARKKRLKEDYIRAIGEDGSDNEDVEQADAESLFIAQGSTHGVSQKRKRPNNDEDYDIADERRERIFARQRRRNIVPEDELKASMMAGMEEALSKGNKASKKQSNPHGSKSRKDKSAKSEKSASKKSKATGKGTRKAGKGMRKGKPSSDTEMQTTKGKKRRRKMVDVESLFSNNVYTAANSNVGAVALPVVTEKTKNDALKALLASVPIEDRKAIRGEKKHIIDATRTLGKYKVRPDGKGGWKLKGMISSLMNHQVQGAAWMRERESGVTQPLGGLLADEMGFGKTVMMIACMVANPPRVGELNKTTLIVATPALCTQWEREFQKHAAKGTFPMVIRYHASARITGTNALEFLQTADIILTTYTEVVKSYPTWKPPKELLTQEDASLRSSIVRKHQWWTKEFEESRGLLHKIMFHRIVLDEAQTIKNHKSKTSIACRGLNAKHRWALSGTPIQNSIYELYPYFKFLRVKHTGNYEVFVDNFCDKKSTLSAGRLNAFLSQFMIRRTYLDRLFGKPLIQMPKNTEMTIEVEFNQVERAVYDIVRKRYIHKINSYQHDGILEKRYNNVLTMLLRLRQLTGHILMLQGTIEDLIQVEDIERLWDATAGEVTSPDGEGRDMLVQMKKILAEKTAVLNGEGGGEGGGEGEPAPPPEAGEWDGEEQTPPLIFKFRKYLRTLAKDKSKWADLKERSLCHKCSDVPDEPWVTSCMHVYCKECLLAMSSEAADNDEDSATCLECGTIYSESHPCEGLKELATDRDASFSSSSGESTSGRKRRRNPEDLLKWIDIDGQILPSAKVAALTAQIDIWLKNDPSGKIIIFTQFHMMIEIIGRVCQSREWGSRTYHGKMSHQARDRAIQKFGEDDATKVLIASLKCGGVGLNLTMASKVVCIDLWWNSSVEQQAFCRIFRIGQESETYITRFVVKNTVDEKLQEMQKKKKEEIDTAMDAKGARPSMRELMRLFGTVGEDENDKPFILVDDENEFAGEVPNMPDDEDEEGVGGHRPHAKVGPLPWE